jgi:hypothetical protein
MTYNRESESRKLAEGVRDSVAGVALLQVGAVGLGALLVAILHTALADFTGVLAASALAVVGLLIIPAKRRRAKSDLHNKLEDLRERLMGAMTDEFERELEKSLRRLRDAIAPYTRFVRAERTKLTRVEGEMDEIRSSLGKIRAGIDEV